MHFITYYITIFHLDSLKKTNSCWNLLVPRCIESQFGNLFLFFFFINIMKMRTHNSLSHISWAPPYFCLGLYYIFLDQFQNFQSHLTDPGPQDCSPCLTPFYQHCITIFERQCLWILFQFFHLLSTVVTTVVLPVAV